MQLNLPKYTFRTTQKEGRRLIFDAYRRRWVRLTPEEWVRQHFVKFLIEEKQFPASLMAIEKSLRMNQQDFRTDAVVFSTAGIPLLIIECKAPEVKITQKTFDQIVRYNFELQVDYLMVTNGLSHFCCKIDKLAGSYEFLKELPSFREINP